MHTPHIAAISTGGLIAPTVVAFDHLAGVAEVLIGLGKPATRRHRKMHPKADLASRDARVRDVTVRVQALEGQNANPREALIKPAPDRSEQRGVPPSFRPAAGRPALRSQPR